MSASTTHVQGPKHFRTCINGLMGLRWHVILSVGDRVDPTALGPLPPGFEVVQGNAHIKILRYASLFVCAGGIITMSEAAYHGVPLDSHQPRKAFGARMAG